MKILFVASQLYLPQIYGGVQTSTHELCHALISRKHRVAVLVKVMAGGICDWKARAEMQFNYRRAGCKVFREESTGYPVWRAWYPADVLPYVCQREKPNLIVIMTGGNVMHSAFAAIRTGVPLLVQLHDVAIDEYGPSFSALGPYPCVANSVFTSRKYFETYGIVSSVIPPFMAIDRYRTPTTRENVTFINPVPVKGRDIALEIARRCPEIPFRFVEGWTLSAEQREELRNKLKDLPNVTLVPSAKDMRDIYRTCKVLLVPSVFEETFGRVAVEAQASGIPVLSSTRGGLPESVGPGGILLDVESPIEVWADTLREVWRDEKKYNALSKAARRYAQRPELDLRAQTDAWERAMVDAVETQS